MHRTLLDQSRERGLWKEVHVSRVEGGSEEAEDALPWWLRHNSG